MTHPAEDVLVARALEELPPAEASAVDAHLAECEACRGACREIADALGAYALALEPSPPSPDLRGRIVGAARDTHVGAVARHFHLDADAARDVLAAAEDATRWVEGPVPSMRLYHLKGGAPTAGADCGLVRMERGAAFPEHRHVGVERVLVLQGAIHDSDGRVYGSGDSSERLAGTRHSYRAGEACDLVFAIVLFGGIEIVGQGENA
ncbi:MAG: cupin domain-containing protein [Myxococcota bacterium]